MSKATGDLSLETRTAADPDELRSSGSAKRWIVLLAVIAIIASAAWWWLTTPAPPRWVDIRKGDGSILSISTGRDPDGNEIIVAAGYCRTDDTGRDLRLVCYDANNGHVRWEVQEKQTLPLMLIHPSVTMDSAGDVLAGCDMAALQRGDNTVVSKYSGRNGHLLWDWKVNCTSEDTFMNAIPSTSQADRLWVSGIHESRWGYRRFVASLDPDTGVALWQHDLNRARDGFDRPARIHPLRDGGAVVAIPPLGGEGEIRWLFQHLSKNGSLVWEREILDISDLSGCLPLLVDETQGLTILAWISLTGGVEYHFAALDLSTGDERWHIQPHLPCGVEAITSGRDGGIELWTADETKAVHTKWWRWKMDHGIPRPLQEVERITPPLRITLSPSDGSFIKRERILRQNERVAAWLTKPGSESVKSVIPCAFQNLAKPTKQPSWRVVDIDARSLLGFLSRQPGGNAACDAFPEHAALTPSGHLLITGDPAEHKFQWQIRVW